MPPRTLGWISVLLAASLSTASAANRCNLTMSPPVPISMDDLRPVITADIDGAGARFMIDTGSSWNFLWPAAAAEFNLPLRDAPAGVYLYGIGGAFVPRIATARTFSVAGISGHGAEFLVDNNDLGAGIDGILGQDLFRLTDVDVDFDFANGALRFVRPRHCSNAILAYWATTQPIEEVTVQWTSPQQTRLIAKAAVNGHDIHVLFDTGAWRSILSLDAARRAGITPESPGVVPAGATIGLGSKSVRVWAAPIDKFAIGGETIEHTHLLVGDIGVDDADMLLGSDFFLAHHIYVAYSQDKVYFTYNGGPVFDVNALEPAAAAKTSADSVPAAATALVPAAPMDAASYMRRGMAYASRGELAQAIADLTRACELEPTDADCHYQRGLVYRRSSQLQAALSDFTAAIERRPDYFEAYLARAQLEIAKQPAAAEADLDAADRLAPQQAAIRLQLAGLYGLAGEYAGAVHQYDLWIDYHPDDINLSYALSNRCGAEAKSNVDVDRALDDCDTALRLMRKSGLDQLSAATLSNRGLVYLRDGRVDDALANFETALKLRPQSPLARYALGLAELRKGLAAQGQADLAAARIRSPGLARRLNGMGFAP
ncbi:MAG TPA: aspartyl protease family protein [Steroidobacteraceae bacterium]|nr:aspartyl protease family protein [Steroidobacteraceae bacterium]